MNVKMKTKLVILLAFLTLILTGSCNRGTIKYGSDGVITAGKGKAKCEKPNKPYAKEMDLAVKAEVEELGAIPSAQLDTKLKSTVVHLADYSTQGLDRDLLLFRICEMSINRGFTSDQTLSLIENAMTVWDEELKKKN